MVPVEVELFFKRDALLRFFNFCLDIFLTNNQRISGLLFYLLFDYLVESLMFLFHVS